MTAVAHIEPPVAAGPLAGENPRARRRATAYDLMYAVGLVLMLSGLNLPHKIPAFVLLCPIILIAEFRRFANLRHSARLLVIPLVLFLGVHVTLAFRMGAGNGLFFFAQAVVVMTYVGGLALRYSQRSMRGFLGLAGLGVTGLLIYVIIWHIQNHHYVTWKYLNDSKVVFNLLPVTLLVLRKTETPLARRLFPIALAAFTLAILLSGERKAYILLALTCPFMLNLRNPVVYCLPLALLAATPLVSALDQSGYVQRQIDTLSGFMEGRVVRTVSNDERLHLAEYAASLYRNHPISGVGTGAYTSLYSADYGKGINAHNEWMRVAAENGTIGLFFYGATVIYGVAGVLRRRTWGRPRSATERQIAAALLLSCIVYFSFEAYKFIVLSAFCLTPFIQYLRLDPRERPGPPPPARRRTGPWPSRRPPGSAQRQVTGAAPAA
jgi:hypothetical protein